MLLPTQHSAIGALTASVFTLVWNHKHPDRPLSVMWMSILGVIVARVPDWDINFVEFFEIGSSNWAHRSVYTHSIYGIFLFGILVIIINIFVNLVRERLGKVNTMPYYIVPIILIIAFATHIVGDAFENYPTRLFYPFSSNEFRGWIPGPIYKTNSFTLITNIVGYGTAIVLSIIQYKRDQPSEV